MPSQKPFRCSRCNKSFRSASAKQRHVQDSANHYLCHICPHPFDYRTQGDLNDHLEIGHHICTTCDYRFRTSGQLVEHDVERHNMCITCRKYFRTSQNLKMHTITHIVKDVECPGCDRLFVTESAMLLHLEAGTCRSNTDCYDVTRWGQECYESHEYRSRTPGYRFECPTCGSDFRLMSSLIQHAESDICEENLDLDTPLGEFLGYVWTMLR